VLRTLTTLRKKLTKQGGEGVETLKDVMKERYPKSEYSRTNEGTRGVRGREKG